MKRYLIFAALVAAFLAPAGNASARSLTSAEAYAAAYAYNTWVACEPGDSGHVYRARRLGPRRFRVRVEWLVGTDEFSDPATGEYYKDYLYQLETVTVRIRRGRVQVWTPYWGGWYKPRLRAGASWHPSAMLD